MNEQVRELANQLFANWMTGREEQRPAIQLLPEDFAEAKDGTYLKKGDQYVPSDFHSKASFETPRYRFKTSYPQRLMRHSLVIASQALEQFA